MKTKNPLPIELLDPQTYEVKHTFTSVTSMCRATKLSYNTIYNRLHTPFHKRQPVTIKEGTMYAGVYIIEYADEVLEQIADEWIVTDGQEVYHKGSKIECLNMKQQLGFPTLSIKPWQQTQ